MHFKFFACFLFFFSLFSDQYPRNFEGKFEEWESKRLELVHYLLKKNDATILHAGGYYGEEAIYLSTLWPEGKIITLEPNPHAFEILSKKVEEVQNIYPFQIALNSYTGTAPFYVCHGSSGSDPIFEHVSSLLKPSIHQQAHYRGPIIDVDCTTIDDFLEEKRVDHVDVMCLDLRGSELHALVNAPKALKNVEIIYVHTNMFPFRVGITFFHDLRKYLENQGFSLVSHWYREGFEGDAIFQKVKK